MWLFGVILNRSFTENLLELFWVVVVGFVFCRKSENYICLEWYPKDMDFLWGLVFIVMDILKIYLVYFKVGAVIVQWGESHVINTTRPIVYLPVMLLRCVALLLHRQDT